MDSLQFRRRKLEVLSEDAPWFPGLGLRVSSAYLREVEMRLGPVLVHLNERRPRMRSGTVMAGVRRFDMPSSARIRGLVRGDRCE
jgi:hypothetical protein